MQSFSLRASQCEQQVKQAKDIRYNPNRDIMEREDIEWKKKLSGQVWNHLDLCYAGYANPHC